MKMWDGRFSRPTDSIMEIFGNSLPIDKEFIEEDIKGSIAWAKALEKTGVLSDIDNKKIISGLRKILTNYSKGKITFLQSDEDIHTAVERLLVDDIGETAFRLHAGRSRNDQVATDFRLYIKRSLIEIEKLIIEMQEAFLSRAEKDKDIIIPGYTHLQQAQAISLAHYWLSFFFQLQREKIRFIYAKETADCMPLGSGALAGSGFTIDRESLAEELGFSRVSENSMDAVSSRDFVLEALAACSSLGILCSRYAEDLIIWSSREFGFIELDEAWSTGSSMMPQKKNPDSLELIRAKSGRLIGNYTGFAATLKGVGLAYYKDLQEDKESLIDSVYNMKLIIKVFTKVIQTIKVKRETVADSLDPLLLATDVADYLVQKEVSFRQAHKIVGKIVEYCIDNAIEFNTLPLEKLKEFSNLFEQDVQDIFQWETALSHRDIQGGTGPKSVKNQIEKAHDLLKNR